jgi:mono/diheme cytochrome c family protein
VKPTRMASVLIVLASLILLLADSACGRHATVPEERPQAFGAAVISISGEKQAASVGSPLDQPLVVQVNDAQGMGVAGALVRFTGARGVVFRPDRGLTGSDGQLTTIVTLGGMPGRYQVIAATLTAAGKTAEIRIDETALGYQETWGATISDIHCVRCHDSESTAERVSNHDNLEAPPHAFTDGSILNSMTNASLLAIIGHGGPALNKSAEMPPYGNTLTKAEIEALIDYMRAVADPPYHPEGVFYAGN